MDFNAFRAPKFGTKTATRETAEKRYQLLHIGVLREYLEIDMRPAVGFRDGRGAFMVMGGASG